MHYRKVTVYMPLEVAATSADAIVNLHAGFYSSEWEVRHEGIVTDEDITADDVDAAIRGE